MSFTINVNGHTHNVDVDGDTPLLFDDDKRRVPEGRPT
jgi:hypothetical protein